MILILILIIYQSTGQTCFKKLHPLPPLDLQQKPPN